MKTAKFLLSSLLLPLTSALHAQTFEPVLRVGEQIDGLDVRRILRGLVDEGGTWRTVIAESPQIRNQNGALVENGNPLLFEGDRLSNPPVRINLITEIAGGEDNTTVVMRVGDFNPPRAYPSAEVVLNRGQVVLQSYEPFGINGLPPNAICRTITGLTANSKGSVLFLSQIDTNPYDVGLVHLEFAADGTPLARELVHRWGQIAPGLGPIETIARAMVNERGKWIVRLSDRFGTDVLLYGSQLVLQSGQPSPIAGRNYAQILRQYDVNDWDDYAVSATLSGAEDTNEVLVKNGRVLFQEGERVPAAVAGAPEPLLTRVGLVRMANSGHVFWQAMSGVSWLGRGTFMRDREPILQTGASRLAGELVTDFEPALDNFEISPSGRFFAARVVLENSGESLVTADLGASFPIPGCLGNPGSLRHTEGFVLSGKTIRVELDAPARRGAIATLHFSSRSATRPGSNCGIPSPFGELLAHPAAFRGNLVVGPYNGSPLAVAVPIPTYVGLIDQQLFVQGSFVGGGRVLLTNGLGLEIGAP